MLANGAPEEYLPLDVYRDFRRVFLDTPEGERVLHQIFEWAGMYRSSAKRAGFDPHETLFHEGSRDLGLQLLSVMASEPTPRETKQGKMKWQKHNPPQSPR